MKKRVLIISILALLAIGCKPEVIRLDFDQPIKRLVIDAHIEFDKKNQTNSGFSVQVKISESASFYDESVKVSGAIVTVTDIPTGTVYTLAETEPSGSYVFYDSKIHPKPNNPYRLTVSYKGQTYIGEEEAFEAPDVIGTPRIDKTKLQEDTYYFLRIKIKDDPNFENFYWITRSMGVNSAISENLRTVSDKYFNGNEYELSYELNSPDNDIKQSSLLGQKYDLKLYSISGNYNNFLDIIQKSEGSLFGGIPATPRGNITNITDKDKYPLGYFYVAQYVRVEGTIE